MTGSPLESTIFPFIVPVCNTACTSPASAKTVCEPPARRAEAITVENRILLDENLKRFFFIYIKFKTNIYTIYSNIRYTVGYIRGFLSG